MTPEQQKALREPFPAEQIGKLPRLTCKACQNAPGKVCSEHQKVKCEVCRNYISTRHIHLDYVGHASVTDRLLAVDPEWSWEPVAFTAEGFPATSQQGGETWLWIKLTVAGVTRYGVGIAESKKFELGKQLISDALRNAAMRFGVALDLWSKEEMPVRDDVDLGRGEGSVLKRTESQASPPSEGEADAGTPPVPASATAPSAFIRNAQARVAELVGRDAPQARRDAYRAFMRSKGFAHTANSWTEAQAIEILGWFEQDAKQERPFGEPETVSASEALL